MYFASSDTDSPQLALGAQDISFFHLPRSTWCVEIRNTNLTRILLRHQQLHRRYGIIYHCLGSVSSYYRP